MRSCECKTEDRLAVRMHQHPQKQDTSRAYQFCRTGYTATTAREKETASDMATHTLEEVLHKLCEGLGATEVDQGQQVLPRKLPLSHCRFA